MLALGAAFFSYYVLAFSQGIVADSVRLKEVTIQSYLSERPVLRLPSSVSVIDSATLHSQNDQSLLSSVNTVPGVRMEERSPGSYRLSIRGSLLRSPFGIRNVKIYLDDFPLTDAGGNTYLNLLDPGLIERMEILKGPDGSLFGANSGGVVRIDISDKHNDSSHVKSVINGGSFGTLHQYASIQRKVKNSVLALGEGFYHSDGYRENSTMDRSYFHLSDRWNYSEGSQLRFLLFYSDLAYRTPGGLTLQQFNENPAAARPPTATLPGAREQMAGVHNGTLYSGLLNELALTKNLKFVTAFFGSHTNFQNPFITNYETRTENSSGMRTWLSGEIQNNQDVKFTWDLGTEAQRTNSRISNYGNRSGKKDTVQAKNSFDVMNGFTFLRTNMDLYNRLQAEVSFSYNFNQYEYHNLFPDSSSDRNVFTPQLMPRAAVSWLINYNAAWRASVSRGYSPPTLAEILPSGNVFNKVLQPENGYNYETGFRLRSYNKRFWCDVSGFYYRLERTIVRRADNAGNEFFTNAGTTNQQGLESQLQYDVIQKNNSGFIRQLQARTSIALYMFVFENYKMESENYSGKHLTGVPDQTFVSNATIDFPKEVSLFIQHNYTAAIPLNDANSEFADAYNLVQAKASWKYYHKKTILEFYVGVDNLLNAHYSLGNDLNAAGKRYYNAAPPRNYFVGVRASL